MSEDSPADDGAGDSGGRPEVTIHPDNSISWTDERGREMKWKIGDTAPFDPRFPNTNQTKHCYVSFLDYKRCVKLRGECYGPCEYFYRVYKSLCPNAWVAKWEDQISEGKFPSKI